MKKIYFPILFLLTLICGMATSCKSNVESNSDERQLSFDPQDSVLVDELMRFYIDSNIIPQAALIGQPEENRLIDFDCISEDCEISNDFMGDSDDYTFFVEVMYATGSAGNNNIYICQKAAEGFRILYQMEGVINPDVGEEKMENGYKVLYIQQDITFFELYYDGHQFTVREIKPSGEELLTQN